MQSRLPGYQYVQSGGKLWRIKIVNGWPDFNTREEVHEPIENITKMLKHNKRKRMVR